MRRIALVVVSTACLSLFTSCDRLSDATPPVVGEWSDMRGEKLRFDRYGRVAVFDHGGNLVATSSYQYSSGDDTVRMSVSNGDLVGKMVGKRRMQVTGVDGRRRVFSLKDPGPGKPGT